MFVMWHLKINQSMNKLKLLKTKKTKQCLIKNKQTHSKNQLNFTEFNKS